MRKSNWPALLALFIEEKKNQPFVWGENDCCLFTADWICIFTGQMPSDPAKYRGTYTTAKEAMALVDELGGVEAVWQREADIRGWKACPTALAQRGDIATVDTDRYGPSIGVVIGATVVYAGKDGIAEMPVNKSRKAWRIY
jgi:hypothetical protein